ncbi:FAD-dependent monooxygenase [Planctomonas psychrotolerans]|uniref:FAD-dependent monooxygenase n=1 Tax=Planctomonas psychrotolerans TaxID=2528712 RepID=UPI001D0D4375|nr:FAD-dependent monooxygenase [Planctomonas psychrotolerans]
MTRSLRTDVLVVGAGPTGLMLANVLARRGVDVRILDSTAGPTVQSRALGVQARSMEIYDQLGLADRVLAGSARAEAVAPGFGARVFGRVPLGELGAGITPYPRIHVFEQSRNEQLLADSLAERGVPVLWRHEVQLLDETAEGVSAIIHGPDGHLTVTARYCVGTDGASSTVRRLRGIPFEGITNEHTFYVLDVVGARGLAVDAINLRPGPEAFLLTFPMGPGGHARLLGTVRDSARGAELTEEAVRRRLDRLYGVRYDRAAWFSTYRVHHRIAARFRDGPVFLAGDAAHVHSPVGAQGMNTGLQDAHNLAVKLADVLVGGAPDAYLDRYEAERRPVARRLVASTDRVFGLVTTDSLLARAFRRVAVSVAAPVATRVLPRVRASSRLFEYISQVRVHYWLDPGAKTRAGGRRGAVVGRRLPFTGDNFDVLRSFDWQVHAYGGAHPAIVQGVGGALGLEVHVFPTHGNRRLRAGWCYLVRPDGFVAAEALPGDAVRVFAAALPFAPPFSR